MKFSLIVAALVANVSAMQLDTIYTCTWTSTTDKNFILTPSKVALGTCTGTHCTHGFTDGPESAC